MNIDPQQIIFLALALIPSLAFHEAAHAYVAYYFGDPTAKYAGRLTLNPLAHLDPIGTIMILFAPIGWGKPVPVNLSNLRNPRWHGLLVSLAGPASNFVLALILAFILRFLPPNLELLAFFQSAIVLNLSLMVFNLLPVPPLDGSKIVMSLFPPTNPRDVMNYVQYGPLVLLILIFFLHDFLSKILSYVIFPLYNFVLYVS